MSDADWLNLATRYLQEEVAPRANQIDEDPVLLRSALTGLGDRQLLALRVPPLWGGQGVDGPTFHQFQAQVAQTSGALAFLQAQHQSAATLLMKSPNEALKQAYLPGMGRGKTLVGIGFSHLRRAIPPLRAIAQPDGSYQIDGQVPWLTGFSFFETIVLAASLPDGQAVYGMVPFQASQQAGGGAIEFSPPLPLAAMAATQTVTAQVEQWVIPKEQVAVVRPAGAIAESDRLSVLNHSAFALGCAQAGLTILAQTGVEPTVATALAAELTHCQQQIWAALIAPIAGEDEAFAKNLRLRVWSIDLMARCTQAAVIVSRGAANGRSHPAQRLYREALVFSVAGQTPDVMRASLANLVSPKGRWQTAPTQKSDPSSAPPDD
jgi:alkylation response protein AidB-like acyl-CoA dehydrogenase